MGWFIVSCIASIFTQEMEKNDCMGTSFFPPEDLRENQLKKTYHLIQIVRSELLTVMCVALSPIIIAASAVEMGQPSCTRKYEVLLREHKSATTISILLLSSQR